MGHALSKVSLRFSKLYSFLSENKMHLSKELSQKISEHLKGLRSSFEKSISTPGEEDTRTANPFEEEEEYFQAAQLSIKEKEKLIELSTDNTLKAEFKGKSLSNFLYRIYPAF